MSASQPSDQKTLPPPLPPPLATAFVTGVINVQILPSSYFFPSSYDASTYEIACRCTRAIPCSLATNPFILRQRLTTSHDVELKNPFCSAFNLCVRANSSLGWSDWRPVIWTAPGEHNALRNNLVLWAIPPEVKDLVPLINSYLASAPLQFKMVACIHCDIDCSSGWFSRDQYFIGGSKPHQVAVYDEGKWLAPVLEIPVRGAVSGLLVLENDFMDRLLVSHQDEKCIDEYTREGTFVGTLASGFAPVGMTLGEQQLFVADFSNGCVAVLDSITGKRIAVIKMPDKPCGVWYCGLTTRLFVTCPGSGVYFHRLPSGQSTDPSRVTTTTLGQHRKSGRQDGEFNCPVSVVTRGRNGDCDYQIVVLDQGHHRVQVFGKLGKFIRWFGTKGTESGQFERIVNLFPLPTGRIAVVDSENKRVQIFE